ncbi:hypothetical protein [Streptomyces sp. BPTC-684]|uniref:hypothetical protein n=1 Tax=Streptomyces sp. BPTC-684 TaxID=3043734 RepID=UPI0024B160EB|nr:hypothetical protein [Streptomyces sp. BPTC-684]WHM35708.1 hypothetical protein QIY60_01510 [Streptomyces sp. BPTC-684]
MTNEKEDMINIPEVAARHAPEVPTRYVPPADPRRGPGYLVISCPHCGARHQHGAGDPDDPSYGHRVAHCRSGPRGGYILIPEGQA